MPMFYQRPSPLDRSRHQTARLRAPSDVDFAALANSLPVMVEEFTLAARDFPILFTDGPVCMAIALLGLRQNQNLFLAERDGKLAWRTECYIPAYVRRYPLVLMETDKPGEFTVCIDEAAEFPEGPAIFESGEMSKAGQEALEFCRAYQNQIVNTQAFGAALQDNGLLDRYNAEIKLESGETFNLTGFLAVNPAKFDALSDEVYLEFRRKGWIGLIHAHIASALNWQRLMALTTLA
ncbi:SapC family protein [Skermanella stibiiresistens SB22]|uniref:SapC family protein n=1 Tax=Skermanella stibiiresistens SB22 TaxID=1385369 RepID=W9HBU4_9PROT|nr:SapC family protein [Skermanella stibiiresistens SB22]